MTQEAASEAEGMTLQLVELYVAVSINEERESRLLELAKVVQSTRQPTRHSGDVSCVVDSVVLSQSEATPFYALFHIDRVSSDSQFFCHIKLVPRPATPPPATLQTRLQEGASLEWLFSELAAVFNEVNVALADAHLELRSWAKKKSAPVAAPLLIGEGPGAVLELSGAEYRSPTRPSTVRSFRWSDRSKSKTLVWIGYSRPWSPAAWIDTPATLWKEESERCGKMIADLL